MDELYQVSNAVQDVAYSNVGIWISIFGLAFTIVVAIVMVSFKMGVMDERINQMKKETVSYVRKEVLDIIVDQLREIRSYIEKISNKK